jgi:hypothetical protein
VAEDALKAERKAGREPHPASWAAPKARRAWLDGKITDAQLSEAYSAAYSAAYSLARSATYSATAYSAACGAAGSAKASVAAHSAAYNEAYRATYRATRERQNRKLTTMILQAHAKEMK